MTEYIQRSHAILKVEIIPPKSISVWLSPSTESEAFHCACGKFLFYHQHKIIAMVQDDMSHVFHSPPITIKCRKSNHEYRVHIF